MLEYRRTEQVHWVAGHKHMASYMTHTEQG